MRLAPPRSPPLPEPPASRSGGMTAAPARRGGRVAEGTGLLSRHAGTTQRRQLKEPAKGRSMRRRAGAPAKGRREGGRSSDQEAAASGGIATSASGHARRRRRARPAHPEVVKLAALGTTCIAGSNPALSATTPAARRFLHEAPAGWHPARPPACADDFLEV